MSRYLSNIEEDEAVALYQSGKTCREIGKVIGRSKTTIQNVLRRRGISARAAAARDNRGARNPSWKGGRFTDADGYVHVWTPNGYVLEHRLVAGALPGEVVHHKDENPSNNSPENLKVCASHAEHRAHHVAEQRARYGKANYPPPMPGEEHPKAVLSEADVLECRRLRGMVSQRVLGERFGVSKTAIRYAQTGRNWKHVPQKALARARKKVAK